MLALSNVSLKSPKLSRDQLKSYAKAREVMKKVPESGVDIFQNFEGSSADLDPATNIVTLNEATPRGRSRHYTGNVTVGTTQEGKPFSENISLLGSYNGQEQFIRLSKNDETTTYTMERNSKDGDVLESYEVIHDLASDTISFAGQQNPEPSEPVSQMPELVLVDGSTPLPDDLAELERQLRA